MNNAFFRHKFWSDDIKKQLYLAVDKNDAREIYNILSNNGPIYIGQCRDNWKFTWAPHDFQYFRPNVNSFINWLKSADYITDVYDKKYTVNEFLDLVNPMVYDQNLWDTQKFMEHNPEEQDYFYSNAALRKRYSLEYNISVNKWNDFYLGEYLFNINELYDDAEE